MIVVRTPASTTPGDRFAQLVHGHLRAAPDAEAPGLGFKLFARLRPPGADGRGLFAERFVCRAGEVLERLLAFRPRLRLLDVAFGGASLLLGCHRLLLSDASRVATRLIVRRTCWEP